MHLPASLNLAAPAPHPQSGRAYADRHHSLGQLAGVSRARHFAAIARRRTRSDAQAKQMRKLSKIATGQRGRNGADDIRYDGAMSELGQTRTFRRLRIKSALPRKADIAGRTRQVRLVPIGDILLLAYKEEAANCGGPYC